jgi:hypothetical protein
MGINANAREVHGLPIRRTEAAVTESSRDRRDDVANDGDGGPAWPGRARIFTFFMLFAFFALDGRGLEW